MTKIKNRICTARKKNIEKRVTGIEIENMG